MVRRRVRLWGAAMVLAAAVLAHGQESETLPSPYFDCPYVNYFDSDCPQLHDLRGEQERRRPQRYENTPAVPAGQGTIPPAKQGTEGEHGSLHPGADETYLLFPKESLAPDAPALFRLLLTEPTIENARRYVRWYARRAARLQAVQALIQLAGSELEARTTPGREER